MFDEAVAFEDLAMKQVAPLKDGFRVVHLSFPTLDSSHASFQTPDVGVGLVATREQKAILKRSVVDRLDSLDVTCTDTHDLLLAGIDQPNKLINGGSGYQERAYDLTDVQNLVVVDLLAILIDVV